MRMLEVQKAQVVELKRREKERKAQMHKEANTQGFKLKALDLEEHWERKMDYIMKLRDMEEFKRGMAKAEIDKRDYRFRDWL